MQGRLAATLDNLQAVILDCLQDFVAQHRIQHDATAAELHRCLPCSTGVPNYVFYRQKLSRPESTGVQFPTKPCKYVQRGNNAKHSCASQADIHCQMVCNHPLIACTPGTVARLRICWTGVVLSRVSVLNITQKHKREAGKFQ